MSSELGVKHFQPEKQKAAFRNQSREFLRLKFRTPNSELSAFTFSSNASLLIQSPHQYVGGPQNRVLPPLIP
jgi:hypothetical protein